MIFCSEGGIHFAGKHEYENGVARHSMWRGLSTTPRSTRRPLAQQITVQHAQWTSTQQKPFVRLQAQNVIYAKPNHEPEDPDTSYQSEAMQNSHQYDMTAYMISSTCLQLYKVNGWVCVWSRVYVELKQYV